MSLQVQPGADVDKVLRAFQGPRSAWRTADGVSRQTALPLATVMRILTDHPELFVKSAISLGGFPTFGLRERVESDLDE
jgi:hypothetical protein